MLTVCILLAELIGSTISLVWVTAMLGFADETHRSSKANFCGRVCAVICMILAFLPLLVTGWLGWRYYFSPATWQEVPLGWWFHVVVSLLCFPACFVMINLYKATYKNKL